MSAIAYVNGEFCDLADAKISILDRGLIFADSLYEALRINNGRLFRVGDHYARMTNGLNALAIPVPFSADEYGALLGEVARRNGIQSGLVYIQVSRGAAMRSHLPPKALTPNVFSFIQEGPVPGPRSRSDGVAVLTVEDTRWERCNIKTTMLIANVLAKKLADDAGAAEAIFVSKEDIVREGNSSNIFAVIAGTLRTHPADNRILPGVTRKVVLELARKAGIPAAEEAFSVEALLGADEAFITSTSVDVRAVVRVDGQPIGGGRVGPVAARLLKLLTELLRRRRRFAAPEGLAGRLLPLRERRMPAIIQLLGIAGPAWLNGRAPLS